MSQPLPEYLANATRIIRLEHTIKEYCRIVKDLLPRYNSIKTTRRESMSLSIIERVYYNGRGILLMLNEYKQNDNMAIPLSQIFRVIAYDVVYAYWLLDDAADFEERLSLINHDAFKPMLNKIKTLKPLPSTDGVLATWQRISPNNFETGQNGPQLKKLNPKRFSEIVQEVEARYQEPILHSLSLAYALLSQQAHLSVMSKKYIDHKPGGQLHIFDSVTYSMLHGSIWILDKVKHSEKERALLSKLRTSVVRPK